MPSPARGFPAERRGSVLAGCCWEPFAGIAQKQNGLLPQAPAACSVGLRRGVDQIPLPRLSTPATSSSRPRSAGLALAVPQGFLMPAALGLPRPGASGIHSFESFQTLWALLFKPLFASQLLLSEFQMQIPRVYPRDSTAGGPGWGPELTILSKPHVIPKQVGPDAHSSENPAPSQLRISAGSLSEG